MRPGSSRLAAALGLAAIAVTLPGCEQVMRNMYEQPKLDPGEASPLFADLHATRAPPEGSVARAEGDVAAMSSGRHGADAVETTDTATQRTGLPHPLSRELLLRGQQRFEIYCVPCHSPLGDGDGPVVRRGFPAPPSYHSDRLRDAPDRHFYDVITHGYGIMHSYADRVTPSDRWAIVGYIRALQLSQHAHVAALPRAAAPGSAVQRAPGTRAEPASAPASAPGASASGSSPGPRR